MTRRLALLNAQPLPKPESTRVITISNQKGGVAKTTSVHSLAAGLVELGDTPLVVDLDPQASLTWACGFDPDSVEVSIHDVLLGLFFVTQFLTPNEDSVAWVAHAAGMAAGFLAALVLARFFPDPVTLRPASQVGLRS